jgi:integrase
LIAADAQREELVHRNAARLVRPPTVHRQEVRVLTVDDASRLVSAIRGHTLEALWLCALTLGLRSGELLGLHWNDIDFGTGLLTVRRALQRVDGRLILVEPQTALSRRTVPVPEPTLAALRAHRGRQNAHRLAAGTAWVDSGLVFSTRPGNPLEPCNVNRSWYTARTRAGLARSAFTICATRARHSCSRSGRRREP